MLVHEKTDSIFISTGIPFPKLSQTRLEFFHPFISTPRNEEKRLIVSLIARHRDETHHDENSSREWKSYRCAFNSAQPELATKGKNNAPKSDKRKSEQTRERIARI